MLTAIDDLTIHQTIGTMDQVHGRNPRWCDKLWFHAGTVDGRLSVAVHLGVYPATRTMDGAAAAVLDGRLYSARFSRLCVTDRDERRVGDLSAMIEEHFRAWRFTLAAGDGRPFAFDLRFLASRQPMEVSAPVFQRSRGQHVTWDLWHYAQAGRAEGTVQIGSTEIRLEPATSVAVRDRSWGVRPIFGQVPRLAPVPDSIGRHSFWLGAELPAQSVWCWRIEPPSPERGHLTGDLADETGRVRLDGAFAREHGGADPVRIVSAQPDLDLDGLGRLRGGSVSLTTWDGQKQELRLRPLTTLYGKALGYGHPDFRHNEWKGVALAQYEETDLADEATQMKLAANDSGHINPFGIEHLCEVSAGSATGHGVVRLSI
ncbi:MAG: hypothetical protein IT429_20800 [Gemmataceae bacterium]|nr:hypothetical protein [Gemmataceae bacterium]